MNNLFAEASGPHISIAPETIFHVGPIGITNAFLLGIIGSLLLIWLLRTAVRHLRAGKQSRLQHAVVWMFEGLYDTTVEVVGDRAIAKKILPLAVTIFLFFVINNWLGILPFVGPITYNGTPLFRGAAADLNMTLAVAVISMVTAQLWAMKRRGFFGNLHRYFSNPFKDPLHAFEGILEFIAEFSRTAALALRMFGNVFGGEVLLTVIGFLTVWASPLALPVFYVLELFVGVVQAYVFFMLTIAFISLGLPSAHDDHAEPETVTEPSDPKPKLASVPENQ
jgi:F-type H+-transporting ATPase subunit a